MKMLRVVLGVFGLLVALFAGGCALLFGAEMVSQWASGMADSLAFLPFVLVFGVLPAGLGALLAWWGLRKSGAAPAPEDTSP